MSYFVLLSTGNGNKSNYLKDAWARDSARKKYFRDDHINNNYDNYVFADIETASKLNKSFLFPLSSRATNENKQSNSFSVCITYNFTFNGSMMFYLSQFSSWYLAIWLR